MTKLQNVIVDTNVWSEAFRKKGLLYSDEVRELRQLIEEGRVAMLGLIRMEILCGIRSEQAFELFQGHLTSFPDENMTEEVYELAAQFYNTCRSKGVQGSNTDFIICACAYLWRLPILTKDLDFERFADHLPIRLHDCR